MFRCAYRHCRESDKKCQRTKIQRFGRLYLIGLVTAGGSCDHSVHKGQPLYLYSKCSLSNWYSPRPGPTRFKLVMKPESSLMASTCSLRNSDSMKSHIWKANKNRNELQFMGWKVIFGSSDLKLQAFILEDPDWYRQPYEGQAGTD